MGKNLAVIVTAAGSSTRFNSDFNNSSDSNNSALKYNTDSKEPHKKEYMTLNGHSVLYHSCKAFMNRDDVAALYVTYPKGDRDKIRVALEDILEQRKIQIFLIEGGASRQESVFNALSELKNMYGALNVDFVAIHDAARPFVKENLISDVIETAEKCGAATPVLPVTDTMVRLDVEHNVKAKEDRNSLYSVQTPQVFAFPDIFEAHLEARLRSKSYSDDATLFFEYGRKVASVQGDSSNLKITYAKDLKWIE